jgi:site-specific DNA-methyltransferase (adenine-specific)
MFTVPVLALWNIPKPQWVAVWHKPQSFGFWSTPMYPHWEPIVMYRMPGKALRPDIFTCNPQPPNGHPTPKPLVLWLALLLCLPGIVADPYMGSGTTLLAAKILGRRAIGIEIEERYCELAATRLAQDVLPLSESVDATPTQTTL